MPRGKYTEIKSSLLSHIATTSIIKSLFHDYIGPGHHPTFTRHATRCRPVMVSGIKRDPEKSAAKGPSGP